MEQIDYLAALHQSWVSIRGEYSSKAADGCDSAQLAEIAVEMFTIHHLVP